MQIAPFSLGADHRNKIAMPLQEGNFINAQRGKWLQGIPFHSGRNPSIQNTQQRIRRHMFLRSDIRQGAIDELDNEMSLIGVGVEHVWVIPIAYLRGRRMPITPYELTQLAFFLRTGRENFCLSFFASFTGKKMIGKMVLL